MKVGIIGAGTVGTTLAKCLAGADHDVLIANSRGADTLREKVTQMGATVEPVALADLLERAEIFLLALPWRNVRDLLALGTDWRGRILVDATNIILGANPDFVLDDLKGDSGSELIARGAPSARVVKAFNTLPFETMFTPAPKGFRRVLFVAGDESEAVSTVSKMIGAIGFEPVAIGTLTNAGRQMEIGGVFSRLELYALEVSQKPADSK